MKEKYAAQYKWNKEHPEKRREMSRNWYRKNTLSLGDGRYIKVKKRDYPMIICVSYAISQLSSYPTITGTTRLQSSAYGYAPFVIR